jgi:hypothetical protein
MLNSDRLKITVGQNNETVITIQPDADKAPRQIRAYIVKTVADLLGIEFKEVLTEETLQSSAPTLGEIIDANGSRYVIPSEMTRLAKSGQAGWVILCESHVGHGKAVEATQLAREVKAKFSNLFGQETDGSVATGTAKSFQKLIDMKFVSYEEYNPDPSNQDWKRRRYWVEPEQAKKLKRMGL